MKGIRYDEDCPVAGCRAEIVCNECGVCERHCSCSAIGAQVGDGPGLGFRDLAPQFPSGMSQEEFMRVLSLIFQDS
jgi:hypothetical protein